MKALNLLIYVYAKALLQSWLISVQLTFCCVSHNIFIDLTDLC